MIKKNFYFYLKLVLLSIFILYGRSTFSAITCTLGGNSGAVGYPVNFPSIVIGPDTPNGTVLATFSDYASGHCKRGIFDSSDNLKFSPLSSNLSGSAIPGYSNVVPTGIAGLGLRLSIDRNGGSKVYFTSTRLNDTSKYIELPTSTAGEDSRMNVFMEIIKTGNINSNITSFTLPDIRFELKQGILIIFSPWISYFTNPKSWTMGSCSLETPNITVDLGRVMTTEFNGVGSTSEKREFQMSLNCLTGTPVKLFMDKTNENQEFINTVYLSPESTAQGVGIRINRAGYEENNIFTESGYALLKPTVSGITNYAFEASYISTGGEIKAGTANANVGFTLKYY